jgi:hypothetical protein
MNGIAKVCTKSATSPSLHALKYPLCAPNAPKLSGERRGTAGIKSIS